MAKMLESNKEYGISRVFAVRFKPIIKHSVPIINRPRSAFLIPIKGKIFYSFENTYFEVGENELLYLPKSSNYTYQVDSGDCEYMQVEFDLFETENGVKKDVIFSENPCKKEINAKKVQSCINDIINGYNSEIHEYKYKAFFSLYEMISMYLHIADNKKIYRISKALKYIEENKFNKIYIEDLAQMCNMSQAQFRRIFRENMGCSPIKYKNNLIINAACEMLKIESFTVSEVACALDFDDVYSFSKFFKRETGISPNAYKLTVKSTACR